MKRVFKKDKWYTAILPVGVFALVGTALLLATHAATPVQNSFEPEDGTTSANAVKVSGDPNASQNGYVRFQAPATGGGTGGIPQAGSIAPIASNFNVSQYEQADSRGLPSSSASEPSGNFRIICEFSHLAYDDPIVYPGQPGLSHLHMFFGNDQTNAFSTYNSLRTSGDSSCEGGPLNRSGYWAPATINANGKVVVPDYLSVYYKENGPPLDLIKTAKEFPPGFRMIAGQKADGSVANTNFEWYCEITPVSGNKQTIPNCPTGEHVGVVLHFPSCWNGHDLDSPDHRSHVAYGTYGDTGQWHCPPGFPVLLPEFTLGIWYTHDGNSKNWHVSSDQMPGMLQQANGASFHSDWFGAWDPGVMTTWTSKCIIGLLNCVDGQLGDGTTMQFSHRYTGPKLLDVPPHP